MDYYLKKKALNNNKLETSPELELAIIKEEARRAGTHYLWHPLYPIYARTYDPLNYIEFHDKPQEQSTRAKQLKLLEPFRRPEKLDDLLTRHPDKRDMWNKLTPQEREKIIMTESELVARHQFGINKAPAIFAQPEPVKRPVKPAEHWTKNELGPYRGDEIGFFQDDPKIFSTNSKAPHPVINFLGGSTVPKKGPAGTVGSLSHLDGKVKLVVYGDPETKKATSWSLYEWGKSEKQRTTESDAYDWKRVPTVEEAESKPGFLEVFNKFKKK